MTTGVKIGLSAPQVFLDGHVDMALVRDAAVGAQERVAVVSANLRGRDLGSVVVEIEQGSHLTPRRLSSRRTTGSLSPSHRNRCSKVSSSSRYCFE